MIYFDHNATTPVASEVNEAMLPFLTDRFGNPSSTHALGRDARSAIDEAREHVACLLGAQQQQIVFTSGGTESNNLAILGTLLSRVIAGKPCHLIISAIEHPATVEPARFLERVGCRVTVVACKPTGVIDPQAVADALRPETALVSIMHANNEIGTIQPIREIADHCRRVGTLLHTDAAQSVGKISTQVDELGVDLLSMAGHKFYAPKGIGALYVRDGTEVRPLLHGGVQERGLRSGTENVAHIVALGAAAARAGRETAAAAVRMAALRDGLEQLLRTGVGAGLSVHGACSARLPNTLSVNFPQVQGAELLAHSPEICASTGAACHDGSGHVSATLAAVGLTDETARGTVRLSLGWATTQAEIEAAARVLIRSWRELS